MIKPYRNILAIIDIFIFIISLFISIYLSNTSINLHLNDLFKVSKYFIFYYLIFELLSIIKFNMLRRMWSYCSIGDLKILIKIITISTLLTFCLKLLFRDFQYTRYLLVSILVFSVLYSVSRISIRIIKDNQRINSDKVIKQPPRSLIVGAGDAASILLAQINKQASPVIYPICLVDDDLNKRGMIIHNIPVKGNINDIAKLVVEEKIEQITIAIPSLDKKRQSEILKKALQTGVKVNIMPNIEDLMIGNLKKIKFKDIKIEDLLGREPVNFDNNMVKAQVEDKVVLVTGAGGSIGSEICRQIINFNIKKLILLGHGENSIYLIEKELRLINENANILSIVSDVKDQDRISQIFNLHRPDIIYHAAAHKHVPLMEISPKEAVKNNVLGTKNVANAALEYNAEKFVLISTDKAVNPTSVMGASKRLAEIVVQNMNKYNNTKFVSVRFGNVLGSRGSVVPLFEEQIEKGGPITITDFRMTRFFMTIPEAAQLVIQAGILASGGEIFVLDMGESVKIIDLARKMLELHGLSEKDIEIKEIGMRPGEKLYEETLSSSELVSEQIYPKIFIGKSILVDEAIIDEFISKFRDYSSDKFRNEIMKIALIGYEN